MLWAYIRHEDSFVDASNDSSCVRDECTMSERVLKELIPQLLPTKDQPIRIKKTTGGSM